MPGQSVQYRQPVQGMVPAERYTSTALASTARSSSERGWKGDMVEMLSSTWSMADMPESTVITPGREAAYRRAQEAALLPARLLPARYGRRGSGWPELRPAPAP